MAVMIGNSIRTKAFNNSGAPGGWKGELQLLCNQFGGTRVSGKVASNRTKDLVCTTLFAGFNTLYEKGFRVMPRNFRNKHMAILVCDWHERGLQPKTMVTNLTQFRKFASWIGKDGMVHNLPFYLPNVDPKTLVVRAVATKAKSFSGNGLDPIALIKLADQEDARFGCIIRLMYAFGFRRKECLLCDPWVSDNQISITVFAGQGKGNRARLVSIETPGQREVIDYIKTIVKKGEKVGWCEPNGQPKNYKKNYDRFGNLMKKLGITKAISGVTGHSLRAEFAEDTALRKGYIPPTLGGTEQQMPKEDRVIIQKKVCEELGHSKPEKTASYYGGLEMMRDNAKNYERLPSRADFQMTK